MSTVGMGCFRKKKASSYVAKQRKFIQSRGIIFILCTYCWLVWLVVLRIYVASGVFQSYRDLEAGDNQSLKIQVARPGTEPRSSCSASQELNHSTTAAPCTYWSCMISTWPSPEQKFFFDYFTTHLNHMNNTNRKKNNCFSLSKI